MSESRNETPVRRAVAEVDLGAVERNCSRLVGELEGRAALCAVVKADGYGHGMAEVAEAAVRGGATWLAVASATEAWDLRQELREVPILTMGALTPAELEVAIQAASELTVWRPEFLSLVVERAAELGVRPPVHIKLDSGMGRLGERDQSAAEELVRAAAAEDRVELAGLWTHFATADETDTAYLAEQLGAFRDFALPLKEEFGEIVLHAANSAATLREPESHFDMVRCGVAIYGLDPMQADPAARRLEPALELRSYVADVKHFKAGASAGYGRRWSASRDTWIGVIPVGYGDGVRRGLSDNADVLVGGRRYPLVGTVSMDNITVDLGPETEVQPGTSAVLIGSQGEERILAEDLARRLDTINYEVTCGISARVPRAYVR